MALKKTKKNVSTNNKKSTIKKIALDSKPKIDNYDTNSKYLRMNEIVIMNLNLLRTNSLLSKTVMLYFVIIVLSVILFILKYFDENQFKFLAIIGLLTLALGIFPIMINIWQQRQQFNDFLKLFLKK